MLVFWEVRSEASAVRTVHRLGGGPAGSADGARGPCAGDTLSFSSTLHARAPHESRHDARAVSSGAPVPSLRGLSRPGGQVRLPQLPVPSAGTAWLLPAELARAAPACPVRSCEVLDSLVSVCPRWELAGAWWGAGDVRMCPHGRLSLGEEFVHRVWTAPASCPPERWRGSSRGKGCIGLLPARACPRPQVRPALPKPSGRVRVSWWRPEAPENPSICHLLCVLGWPSVAGKWNVPDGGPCAFTPATGRSPRLADRLRHGRPSPGVSAACSEVPRCSKRWSSRMTVAASPRAHSLWTTARGPGTTALRV